MWVTERFQAGRRQATIEWKRKSVRRLTGTLVHLYQLHQSSIVASTNKWSGSRPSKKHVQLVLPSGYLSACNKISQRFRMGTWVTVAAGGTSIASGFPARNTTVKRKPFPLASRVTFSTPRRYI